MYGHFEVLVVKYRHGIQVNWSQNRDTGVTDPALIVVNSALFCLLP